MSAIFILLPLALLFVGIALAWFVWAVRTGQFDDLETPAVRILFDDQPVDRSRSASTGPSGTAAKAGKASAREVDIQ